MFPPPTISHSQTKNRHSPSHSHSHSHPQPQLSSLPPIVATYHSPTFNHGGCPHLSNLHTQPLQRRGPSDTRRLSCKDPDHHEATEPVKGAVNQTVRRYLHRSPFWLGSTRTSNLGRGVMSRLMPSLIYFPFLFLYFPFFVSELGYVSVTPCVTPCGVTPPHVPSPSFRNVLPSPSRHLMFPCHLSISLL